jgi:hypothetical protein
MGRYLLARLTDSPRVSQPKEKMSESQWKAIFGFALLMVIASLAAIIALGKVEAGTSFGLDIILGCLTTLSGGFAAWAFGKATEGK